jgi:tripartite-type tricarboxylate transporter receptor subunit TctC
VAAGEVQSTFNTIPPTLPYLKSNRVRGLAVSSQQRFPSAPDVPTFIQAGLPQYGFGSWYGILAPAKTPAAVIERVNREIAVIIQLPDVREKVAGFGAEPLASSPKEFSQFLAKDIAQWSKVVRDRNIRAD